MKKIKVKKVKKVKQPSKKTISKRLWKEVRDKVVVRDEGKCQVCGCTSKPNAHHIIGKGYAPTRYDERNLILLCSNCHKFSRLKSAHNNSVWFVNWLKENKPNQYNFVIELTQDKTFNFIGEKNEN